MSVKMSITGVREIDAVLREMPRQLTHQVLSAAHAAAAKPLINRAKLLAPEGPTGQLIDSIGAVKTSVKRANVIGEVTVGPRRSRRHKGHHGHLIEFGFRTRARSGRGKKTFVPGRPFMKPAFSATQPVVVEGIRVEIGKKLHATMRRHIKR